MSHVKLQSYICCNTNYFFYKARENVIIYRNVSIAGRACGEKFSVEEIVHPIKVSLLGKWRDLLCYVEEARLQL